MGDADISDQMMSSYPLEYKIFNIVVASGQYICLQ